VTKPAYAILTAVRFVAWYGIFRAIDTVLTPHATASTVALVTAVALLIVEFGVFQRVHRYLSQRDA
jgi:hypothetical protein